LKKEEIHTIDNKSLDYYIPTFTNISDWQIDNQYNTGGSRSKKIVTDLASGDIYFYKASKVDKKGEIRYPLEFWSEIVSSKIGKLLGLNILDYNIAYEENDRQPVGCLSKSMVNFDKNKLTEGISYLIGYDVEYNPEVDKEKYTFQFIQKSLRSVKFDEYLSNFVEMLVFDAFISNSDRHQENWGFITLYQELIKELEIGENHEDFSRWNRFTYKHLKRFIMYVRRKDMANKKFALSLQRVAPNKFSPIYDSGCCLGREVTDKKVEQYLKDQQALESYIKKGTSEVHWEGIKKKPNHFLLLEKLMPEYGKTIKAVIGRCIESFDEHIVSQIINNIDAKLPEHLSKYKLPNERKQLMIKILTLRLQKLKELI